MYILCFAQKDVLRGGFGPLQSGAKGANTEMWICCGGYAYILSMGRDCVSAVNTHSTTFFCAPRRWTAIGVGADRHHPARGPLSYARGPLPTKRRAVFCTARPFLYRM